MRSCESCGKSLRPEQFICECGAAAGVAQPEIGNFGEIDMKVPKLDLGKAELRSLDLSFAGAKGGSLPSFDLKSMADANIDLRTRQGSRGRPYRIEFAIGGAEADSVRLCRPAAVACLPNRDLLVLDFKNEESGVRIQRFDADGGLRKVVTQQGKDSSEGSIAVPAALAIDFREHIFVSDMDGGCVKEFGADGAFLSSHGRAGTGEGELDTPRALVVDAKGNLYIADSGNNRITRWLEYNQDLVVGINRLDEAYGWLQAGDGPGEFDDPQGLALGSSGHIFVADTNNHRIQKLDSLGQYVSSFGSEGEEAGKLSYPNHVRLGPGDEILVADLGGRRLQRFDDDGNFSYEIALPEDAGALTDFAVDSQGRIVIALPSRHLVIAMEVSR